MYIYINSGLQRMTPNYEGFFSTWSILLLLFKLSYPKFEICIFFLLKLQKYYIIMMRKTQAEEKGIWRKNKVPPSHWPRFTCPSLRRHPSRLLLTNVSTYLLIHINLHIAMSIYICNMFLCLTFSNRIILQCVFFITCFIHVIYIILELFLCQFMW